MKEVDLDELARDLGFVLKSEQKEAVRLLLSGRDVFAVLPTGFGKSLIYQSFVLLKEMESESSAFMLSIKLYRFEVFAPPHLPFHPNLPRNSSLPFC